MWVLCSGFPSPVWLCNVHCLELLLSFHVWVCGSNVYIMSLRSIQNIYFSWAKTNLCFLFFICSKPKTKVRATTGSLKVRNLENLCSLFEYSVPVLSPLNCTPKYLFPSHFHHILQYHPHHYQSPRWQVFNLIFHQLQHEQPQPLSQPHLYIPQLNI